MELESSEYLVRFAVKTGAFTFLVMLLIVALMLVMRFTRVYEQRASSNLTAKWFEVLGGAGTELQADLRRLPRRPAFYLLRQWTVAYERARLDDDDASRQRHLIESAEKVGLPEFAFELVESGTNEEIMASAIALGYLKLEQAWIPLKRRASTPHPFVSAVAMEALIRIDADRALPVLAKTLSLQADSDWPDHVLGRILREMSESQIHATITKVVAENNYDAVLHLFRGLERRGDPSAEVVLEWLLDHRRSADDLIACCYAALQKERLDAVLKIYHASAPAAAAQIVS